MEKISCIIPTYKKFEYLKEALDSVFLQDYPKIELIVADDGSDNIDLNDINNYIKNNKKANIIDYKVITQKKNVGTVKNMNAAIKKCSGNIIIPLAADDKFYNEHVISLIVERFISTNACIIVCSRLKCSEDLQKKIRLIPHPKYIKYIEKKMNTALKQFHHVALGNSMEFASGAAMYYTKDFFEKVNGYDERYILWEDGPFIAKSTRLGYKIETAYDMISIYYRDGGISSKAPKTKELSRIENDYINQITNEFINYKNMFNKLENKIIVGRKELQKNKNRITFQIVFRHPEAVINLLKIKINKFVFRYFIK